MNLSNLKNLNIEGNMELKEHGWIKNYNKIKNFNLIPERAHQLTKIEEILDKPLYMK